MSGNEFATQNITVAAHLCCTRKLDFVKCIAIPSTSRIEFLFNDPQGIGPDLEIEILRGAECNSVQFYNAIRDLRSQMNCVWETSGQRKNNDNRHAR